MYPVREGTPYKELHAPIVYGLLAHSHSWKAEKSTPENNIRQKLLESDSRYVSHPRESLDLICVADLATWTLFKNALYKPIPGIPGYQSLLYSIYGANGSVATSYIEHTPPRDSQSGRATPIGNLISSLSGRIAWEDPALRALAEYYRYTGIAGGGRGRQRHWPISIYSEKVRRGIQEGGKLTHIVINWDEWQVAFHFP